MQAGLGVAVFLSEGFGSFCHFQILGSHFLAMSDPNDHIFFMSSKLK